MEDSFLIMNDTPRKQEPLSLTPKEGEALATPHFDDSAVATAHQVEPLPKRRAISGSYRFSIIIAAAIIVGTVLGITALALWSNHPSENAPAEATAVPATSEPTVVASGSAEVTAVTPSEPEKRRDRSAPRSEKANAIIAREKPEKPRARSIPARPKRTINSYMAEDFDDESDSRRVARKVGVLYGRSRGEQ